MSKIFLRVESAPRRVISEREAADYCNLSTSEFRRSCPVAPFAIGKGRSFDIHDIDAWLDSLKGDPAANEAELLERIG